jgi:hypothetical protein
MAEGKSMNTYYEYVQTDDIRKLFGDELVAKALKLTVGAELFIFCLFFVSLFIPTPKI